MTTETPDISLLKGWQSAITPSTKTLRILAGATENEFLQIGSKLQDFYQRSSELTNLANRLVDAVAGDQAHTLTERLRHMLSDMDTYMSHAQLQSSESCTTLETVLTHLDTISEPLEGFQKMTKALRMLGISTKIESARMGEAGLGFVTLAQDVEKLSHLVSEKSTNILSHRQSLINVIFENLQAVKKQEKDQGGQIQGVFANINANLDQLVAINERCGSFGTLVSAVSGEVSSNISEVVSSMQMHDMTRQQVEHIIEALDKLEDKLGKLSSTSDNDVLRSIVIEAGDVCELQEAQLRFAASELCDAVSVIIENLREVASKQQSLVDETVIVTGAGDSSNGTFMDTMRTGMNKVTSILSQCAQADQKMSEILESVAGTLQEVTGFVTDIEEIGTEIDLIALNAQVKAALTGNEGAALGVLAEAVKRLSVDAITQTDTVSSTLVKINGATEHLFTEATYETEDLKSRINAMDNEIKDIMSALEGINREMMALLSNLGGRVCSLTNDIDSETSGIDVHQRVQQMADEVGNTLEQIVSTARQIEPASSEFKNNLKFMEERYTMQSERHIHEAIARKRSGGTASVQVKQQAVNSDSEFGDNVDLF